VEAPSPPQLTSPAGKTEEGGLFLRVVVCFSVFKLIGQMANGKWTLDRRPVYSRLGGALVCRDQLRIKTRTKTRTFSTGDTGPRALLGVRVIIHAQCT